MIFDHGQISNLLSHEVKERKLVYKTTPTTEIVKIFVFDVLEGPCSYQKCMPSTQSRSEFHQGPLGHCTVTLEPCESICCNILSFKHRARTTHVKRDPVRTDLFPARGKSRKKLDIPHSLRHSFRPLRHTPFCFSQNLACYSKCLAT